MELQTAALPLSHGVAEGIKWGLVVFGAGIAYPAAKMVWGIASTWTALIGRLDRIEFILIGDEGVNGVRGDVKTARAEVQQVKGALIEQGQKTHTALGTLGLHVEKIDARVTVIDERTAKSPRRKVTRRSADR